MADDERATRAKALLEQGNYREAGSLFHQLWDETGNTWTASRYLYCLRKAGFARAAVTVGQDAHQRYPQDIWIRRELVWALYYDRVKPFADKKELPGLLQAGEDFLTLQPEALPLKLLVLAVIRLAREKGKWDLVSTWCDRLAPESLDNAPREFNGEPVNSEREGWYSAKVKALIHLERWPEALALAARAVALYPGEVNFRRWEALALAGQGQVSEALALLQVLVQKEQPEWYLLQDLAGLHQRLGQYEAAMKAGCRAALSAPEDRTTVTLYQLLATVGLAQGKLEFAARHVVLARLIRQREGWSIPAELQGMEEKLHGALAEQQSPWPVDIEGIPTLFAACQASWRVETETTGALSTEAHLL